MQVIDQDNQPGDVWKGDILGYPDYLFSILECTTPLLHPSVMYRRNAVLQVDKYDINLPYAEDFGLWASLALAGYHAKIITEPLCCYRVHERQWSVLKRQIQRQNAIKVQERMISNFSNEFPAGPIRLFFENSDELWQEVSSPRMVKDIAQASRQVLLNMQTKLNMNRQESSRIKQLFYHKAVKVAIKGTSLSRKRASLPVYLFALRGSPSISKNSYLVYFFYWLPSPVRRIFESFRTMILGIKRV
ncbi:hypothetical protein ACFLWY_00830 [Chloroflexota bacterium]